MKLATRKADHPDGRLLVVSRDLRIAAEATAASTLQQALDDWDKAEPELAAQYDRLNAGDEKDVEPLEMPALAAAMPRAYQFLDASAFLAHNYILADAWGFSRREAADPPLMYQGLSDYFFPAHGDIPFRSEDDLIDFEAEYGVIVDGVPLGTSATAALHHIKLLVVINDWSLRAFGPEEMKAGFGFIQAKPPSAMSAIAMTPGELGVNWENGRMNLALRVHRGEKLFGEPHGGEMSFSFGDLIVHAALTRHLCAGTVIGSGTVSNFDAKAVGSGCISERKALDVLDGKPDATAYLRFGEKVRLDVIDDHGRSLFGHFENTVARHECKT